MTFSLLESLRPALGGCLPFGLVVVDVEAQDVAVFDGVGDGVGVQFLLEEVFGGPVASLLAFDLLIAGVLLEDGRAGEAEELGPWGRIP